MEVHLNDLLLLEFKTLFYIHNLNMWGF